MGRWRRRGEVADFAARLGNTTEVQVGIQPLFLYFLKIGSILYGSGYVLLAFLQSDLVARWHWLTSAQLLDATAVGQVTPGPLFTTATFIGYVLGGVPGAIAATVGIFLPSFVLIAISGPSRSPLAEIAACRGVLGRRERGIAGLDGRRDMATRSCGDLRCHDRAAGDPQCDPAHAIPHQLSVVGAWRGCGRHDRADGPHRRIVAANLVVEGQLNPAATKCTGGPSIQARTCRPPANSPPRRESGNAHRSRRSRPG